MQTLSLIVLTSIVLYVVRLYVEYRRNMKTIRNYPGYRTFLSSSSIFANLLPQIPGIATGRLNLWRSKHDDFEYFGSDIFSVVNMWPTSNLSFRVADPVAIKEITSTRALWPKPVERYQGLKLFGSNIVVTENDEWKKHRRVANPAFSERNNRMVWEETVKIVNDMFDNDWRDRAEIEVDHCVNITLKLALLVIGSAGFGRSISWDNDLQIPPGHQMSFKDALHIVSVDIIYKLAVPDWAMGLTKKLRTVKLAFDELRMYMQDMINERRDTEKRTERYDLFSSLLDASAEDSDGMAKLSDSELTGNIFIFLLAGHETSAHTLCFCFALLALYQDEQETLLKHINTVLVDRRTPVFISKLDSPMHKLMLTAFQEYKDMPKLTYSMAVLYETLRLFPPVNGIPKKAAEDFSLSTSMTSGEKRVIPVPRGSVIILHVPGIHYNPKYWKDPHEFKPKRFLEDYNRDAFIPFSAGVRSCIGRRFSETESIAILTTIVQKYKIEIKDEPQFANETFDERRERILRCKAGITLSPVRVPLVFKRRVEGP